MTQSRGPRSRTHTNTTWRSDLAYAVGLFAADGCMASDGLLIDFTSQDKKQVESFVHILNLGQRKGRKASGRRKKEFYRVQCKNRILYDWLLSIGLTPRKSKTLREIRIPDSYFFDFLRGVFDGDGCIYAYWDPRWHSSYMFYVGFASASPVFLRWLDAQIVRLTGIQGKITRGSSSEQLRFAKAHSRALLERMYYADNIPHLQRKFTKARKILRINDAHNNE